MRLIDANKIKIKPEYMYDICGSVMIRVEDVARIINDMPTIEPQKWIPVSERLPEEKSDVIVTISDGFSPFVDTDLWDGSRFFCYGNHRVEAWCPLPEPYKEKE